MKSQLSRSLLRKSCCRISTVVHCSKLLRASETCRGSDSTPMICGIARFRSLHQRRIPLTKAPVPQPGSSSADRLWGRLTEKLVDHEVDRFHGGRYEALQATPPKLHNCEL